MPKLVIFGTGDVAQVVHYYFTHDNEHEVVAFTVDAHLRHADTFLNLPLLDFEDLAATHPPGESLLFVALSHAAVNKVRSSIYRKVKTAGYALASYVSSRATVFDRDAVGENCLIAEGNVIQPFTSIGNDVFLWPSNVIGHHAQLEDHCFVSSNVTIGPHCRIGNHAFLGLSCTVRNGVRIAPETVIGAGAVVMQDTIEQGVYLPPRGILHQKRSDEIQL